ncbi:hypothetical protein PLICRDRAFT_403847 [Plicaturopsis crispa FD-325 SS-3]|nr:hypothetical protein PLICRDRAFT_403847 [Plicaturopsis crispa FD-325 SS-3]
MVKLSATSCSIDPRPGYPLQVLATKYTSESQSNDGYTLVFLHATGMHKESWDVSIQRLFDMFDNNAVKIREVISIESPNHGESAEVNESAIREHFGDQWPTKQHARAAHAFLTADASQGARIDFSTRKIVGIGHSIGAAALFLMRDLEPRVQFEQIIAIEAGISVKGLPDTNISSRMLTAWTWLRRDTWSSRKAARKDLAESPVYSSWDPRILDLYVRYGLRRHPAAKYAAPFAFNGVTTSLTKVQEAASYRSDHLVVDAMEAYTKLSREIPIHLVWGTIHDVGNPALQAILSDRSAGRTPASVSYIEGAGHLAVQMKPEAVADVIFKILKSNTVPRSSL